jgi:hypothetical protein
MAGQPARGARMLNRRSTIWTAALVITAACQERNTSAPTQATADVSAAIQVGYPASPYRDREAINTLVLAGAQILITHRDAKFDPSFMAVPHVERDKAAARSKAQALSAQLARDPSLFVELAKRESDDRVSAAAGGYLGTFFAPEVSLNLVDAFAALRVGEISHVVETDQGFHIVQRRAVPKDLPVSLSHIVIKHREANGWQREDRPVVEHTREQARLRAEEIARSLREHPEQFDDYAREHSEADDAVRAGDMGTWSRYEPAESALIEVASRLPIGGVSDVVETGTGFHILKHTAGQPTSHAAAALILILHADAQLPAFNHQIARPKAKAEALARELIAELRQHPDRFEQRRIEYCEFSFCEVVHGYARGRGLAPVEAVLSTLEPFEIAAEPIATGLGIAVIRREDPARYPPPKPEPVHFEFNDEPPPVADAEPVPEQVITPEELATDMAGLAKFAHSKMRLDPSTSKRFNAVFGELASALRTEASDAELNLARAEDRLVAVLGPEGHDEFSRHRRVWNAMKAGQLVAQSTRSKP